MTMERTIGGNFRITEKLGEGGMGEVFKGFDTMLEREVAIKSLRPELSSRTDVVERFRTEAIALGRLNNSHIATVYSFLRDADQWFLVLEFVRGETLDKIVARRGAMPWQEAVRLICQALDGLEHAHRLGVVHRDIKPSNMIIGPAGTLKLMDFGIARLLERARLTRTGHLIGTLEYMSPEQIQGRDSDARGDIYSIGIVLYEMLTGQLPFQKESDYDLIRSQVEETPLSPRMRISQIPEAIESIVLKALAKKPEDRFPSAFDFQTAMQALLQPEVDEPHASPETRFAIYGTTTDSRPIRQADSSVFTATSRPKTSWFAKSFLQLGLMKQTLENYPGLLILGVFILGVGLLITFGLWNKYPNPHEIPVTQPIEQQPVAQQPVAQPISPTTLPSTPSEAKQTNLLPPQDQISNPVKATIPEKYSPQEAIVPEQRHELKPSQEAIVPEQRHVLKSPPKSIAEKPPLHKLTLAHKSDPPHTKKPTIQNHRPASHAKTESKDDSAYWNKFWNNADGFLKQR